MYLYKYMYIHIKAVIGDIYGLGMKVCGFMGGVPFGICVQQGFLSNSYCTFGPLSEPLSMENPYIPWNLSSAAAGSLVAGSSDACHKHVCASQSAFERC